MRIFICLIAIAYLTGCATLQPLDKPKVSLTKIVPIKSSGLTPSFGLHLRITNPNNIDLDINGVSFTLAIAEQELFSGVSRNVPQLKAYSDTEFVVQADVSLYELFKLLTSVNKLKKQGVSYHLNVKIDPKNYMNIRIDKKGELTKELSEGLSKGK